MLAQDILPETPLRKQETNIEEEGNTQSTDIAESTAKAMEEISAEKLMSHSQFAQSYLYNGQNDQ